ncbi:MAG: hypothetical protein J5I90_06160 [Caldilineales bacterium]|nr:hypothetical protein [Caldilineales bacterium]
MKLFQSLFKTQPTDVLPPHTIVVVSGLPRSGTSMMMKMLEAGGLEVVSDGQRQADTDNPQGYYEFERVKQLDRGDTAWLVDAEGKVVKVISALLEYLPADYHYRVLFMERQMPEILASQRKMLEHRGEESQIEDEQLAVLLAKHVTKIKAWLAQQGNFSVLYVDYNQTLADPVATSSHINQFLDGILDEMEMARIADPSLYRNRRSDQA